MCVVTMLCGASDRHPLEAHAADGDAGKRGGGGGGRVGTCVVCRASGLGLSPSSCGWRERSEPRVCL